MGTADNALILGRQEFDWEQCAARIREGDRRAFEQLFRAFSGQLRHFAEGYVRSYEVSEEIVQDVFLDIWISRFQCHPTNVRSYLYRAVRNRALNYLKHQAVVRRWRESVRPEHRSNTQTPHEVYHVHEFTKAVHAAIDELPPRCKMVFVLSRKHGLTYREIASALDVSVKAVEAQMHRALRQLREALSPYLCTIAIATSLLLV